MEDMSDDVAMLVARARCFYCGDEKTRQAVILALLFEYAANQPGTPITADSTLITVDSTEITIDQSMTL